MPANDEPIQTADVEADEVLALAADVEHPAAERERDREPGQDQRRRLEQRLREVVRGRVDACRSSGGRTSSGPAPLKMSR